MKQLLFIFIAGIFTGCFSTNKKLDVSEAQSISASHSESPFITTDADGKAALAWVTKQADSSLALCYAVYDGNKLQQEITVPNTSDILPHGENLPKIIFKSNGDVMALWGTASSNSKNKHAGMVRYSQSYDGGTTWTAATQLVNDTAASDQRYYDVALLPTGEIGIIWLDNRKTTDKEGSALYFASTSGRKGFGSGQMIAQPCCQCCRTELFVDRRGGIHALFRGIINDSIRDMVHIKSVDGGKTFGTPQRISEDNWVLKGCPHTGPAMTENNNGLHFAWYTGAGEKGCHYTNSKDDGNSFTTRDTVSSAGSHPQIAALANGELLIVWDETNTEGGTVSKRIAIEKRTAEGKSLVKQYLTAADGNNSYPVITATKAGAFVSYVNKQDQKSKVMYRLVR